MKIKVLVLPILLISFLYSNAYSKQLYRYVNNENISYCVKTTADFGVYKWTGPQIVSGYAYVRGENSNIIILMSDKIPNYEYWNTDLTETSAINMADVVAILTKDAEGDIQYNVLSTKTTLDGETIVANMVNATIKHFKRTLKGN